MFCVTDSTCCDAVHVLCVTDSGLPVVTVVHMGITDDGLPVVMVFMYCVLQIVEYLS